MKCKKYVIFISNFEKISNYLDSVEWMSRQNDTNATKTPSQHTFDFFLSIVFFSHFNEFF